MALVIKYVGQLFYTYLYERTGEYTWCSADLIQVIMCDFQSSDERVKGFPLMASASWIYVILGAYFIFVKWLGPKWMQNRPALELKSVLIVYNTIQAAANLWLGIYVSMKWAPKHFPIDKKCVFF